MAFADDLLKQAFHLRNKEPKTPTQASLRRAVSTAYYALFHLLIEEASANWSRRDTRDYLARAFEHGTMKAASTRAENAAYDPSVSARGGQVAIRRKGTQGTSVSTPSRGLQQCD
jgi:hypothetical protein